MSLASGTRLGPYEILAPLGAGGMGEVYRARDTTLGREVAIKILPTAVATDPDRSARFAREATMLASLNHPHIAQVYGFERAGDTRALVMELVEGEDLARRLTRGALRLNEALPIGRQIAEASKPRMMPASSIATSSLRTSRSDLTAPSRCSTSASPKRSILTVATAREDSAMAPPSPTTHCTRRR